ncbi:hypothetical protein BB561_004257 [Smittium simulii]|uniref:Ribosomal protein L17 n=1 Tax=Smittium simulii TaxID=133385 RepID=A0A2T9YHA1_9FUNG|nr:hypothetical protein BB561_004257 [Smittium simulii]
MPMLNRNAANRKALFRSLTTSLIKYGRIQTTLPKAKALRKHAERMITLGKKGDIQAKNLANAWVYEPRVTIPKLFNELTPRFMDRNGGYTRVIKIGYRSFDQTPMAIIEYLNPQEPKKDLAFNLTLRKLSGHQFKGELDVVKALEHLKKDPSSPYNPDSKPYLSSKEIGINKQIKKLAKKLSEAKIDISQVGEMVNSEIENIKALKEKTFDPKMEEFYKKHFDENTTKLVY